MMRSVYVNSGWLSAGSASAQGLTVLTYWFIARSLGPDAFGRVVAIVGVAMIVVGVADFGFGGWVIRELARHGSSSVLAASLGLRLMLAAIAGVGWILVTLVLWATGSAPGYAILLGFWILLAMTWNALLAPLRAQERMVRVVVVTVFERVALLVAVVAAIEFGHPRSALTLGLLLAALAATILATILVDERALTLPSPSQIKQFFVSSSGFAASGFVLQLQRLDVALVGLVSGSFVAGIYAAPSRLTTSLSIVPAAISGALFPHSAKRNGSTWNKSFLRLLILIFAIVLFASIPLFVFAEPLTVALLGQEYSDSAPVLQVVLVANLVSSINQPISVSYQAHGDEHFVAAALAICMIIGLAGVTAGAMAAGAVGAALGFLVLQIVILAALLVRAVPVFSGQAQSSGASE